jgi:predicted RNA-binding Zn-ribbon protein involved in translation (DUF1610 family)
MAKMKDFMVSVKPDEVMYTSINTSKDGYNSARMVVKKGDSEYMSISYEWEGNNIPGFAMDLMGFMKMNNKETSGIWEGREEEYASYEEACATCKEHNAKNKKMKSEVCPDCGKKMEECVCKKEK